MTGQLLTNSCPPWLTTTTNIIDPEVRMHKQKSNCVYVSEKLKKEILRYIAVDTNKLTNRNDYLFKTQKRTQFTTGGIQLLIKTVSENAGVFDVTSHSLRRTFITELSNKMISARVIQKLARHSSLAITQLYIETNDEQLLKAVNL